MDREPWMTHLVTEYNAKNERVSYALMEIGIYTLATQTIKDERPEAKENPNSVWSLHVDGSHSNLSAGASVTLASPQGDHYIVMYRL